MEYLDVNTYPDYDLINADKEGMCFVKDHYKSVATGNTYAYDKYNSGDGEFHIVTSTRKAFLHMSEKYRKEWESLPYDEYPYKLWLRVTAPSRPDLDGKYVLREPCITSWYFPEPKQLP